MYVYTCVYTQNTYTHIYIKLSRMWEDTGMGKTCPSCVPTHKKQEGGLYNMQDTAMIYFIFLHS